MQTTKTVITEALDRACWATVDDMSNGFVIDDSKVWPLPSTEP